MCSPHLFCCGWQGKKTNNFFFFQILFLKSVLLSRGECTAKKQFAETCRKVKNLGRKTGHNRSGEGSNQSNINCNGKKWCFNLIILSLEKVSLYEKNHS